MGDKNRPEKDDTGYTYTPDGIKIDKNDENGKRKITLAGETINVSQKGSKATDAVAVTPDDVNDLAQVPTDGLYVGIGGNIKVDMADGTTVTFTALKGGVVYPFEVSRIYDTDTTATNIVALY